MCAESCADRTVLGPHLLGLGEVVLVAGIAVGRMATDAVVLEMCAGPSRVDGFRAGPGRAGVQRARVVERIPTTHQGYQAGADRAGVVAAHDAARASVNVCSSGLALPAASWMVR